MRQVLDKWGHKTDDARPEILSPDEFDRETGNPLPNRVRPRRRAGAKAGNAK